MDDATITSHFRSRGSEPPPAFDSLATRPRRAARLRPAGAASVLVVLAFALGAMAELVLDPKIPSTADLMAWTPASDALLPPGFLRDASPSPEETSP